MWQAINNLLVFGLFTLSLNVTLNAQKIDSCGGNPYRLSWSMELPLSLAALSTGISYLVLDAQTPILNQDQLQQFDRTQVPFFDRSATYHWSPSAALASDLLLYTSCAVPLSLLAAPKIRKDYLKITVLYAQTFALTAGLTALCKTLVKRPRPFVYNPSVPISFKQETAARYAFFSGHTSMSAALCFLSASIFQDYHPRHKAVPWLWTAAALVPALTGVLRVQAGKHYWSDVITGYLIGAGIGFCIPKLHKWLQKSNKKQLPVRF